MLPRANLARVETGRSGVAKRPVQTASEIYPALLFENLEGEPNGLQAKENIALILDSLRLSNQEAAAKLGVKTEQISAWRAPSSGKHMPFYLSPRFTEAFGPDLIDKACRGAGLRAVSPAVAEAGELALGIARSGRRVWELGETA